MPEPPKKPLQGVCSSSSFTRWEKHLGNLRHVLKLAFIYKRQANTFGIVSVKANAFACQRGHGFWFHCLLSHSFCCIWLESLKLLNPQNSKL